MKKKSKNKVKSKVNPFVIGPVTLDGKSYNIRNTIKRNKYKVTEHKDKYEGNPVYQYKNWVLMKLNDEGKCVWMRLA